jgi:hypothetical protein
LNRDNFGRINRDRLFAESDHLDYTGRGKNWEPVVSIKLAKQVAGEQGSLDFLEAIRPPPSGTVKRKHWLEAFCTKQTGDCLLVSRPNLEREPGVFGVEIR